MLPSNERPRPHPTGSAVDNLLNMDNRFPAYARAPRLQVEPSLVNHLGFYTSRTKASATTQAEAPRKRFEVPHWP